jgi:hypothetical protein
VEGGVVKINWDEGEEPMYATALGNFAKVCRHCRKSKSKHINRKCLFDSTTWDPLTWDEFVQSWGVPLDVKKIITDETSVKDEP